MFNFSNSFFITPYFLSFLSSVAFVEWGVTVGRCKWVKNPDIKESTLSVFPPEVCCCNVESGSILCVRCSVV